MVKIEVYPKYSKYLSLIISLILLLFSFGPLVIKTDEGLHIKLIWSLSMIFLSVLCCFGFLWDDQTLLIEEEEIVLMNHFCIIKKMKKKDIFMQTVELPTYSSGIISINKRWICIYEKDKYIPRFKSGCNNSKKYNRIQVIYSDSNYKLLSNEIDKYSKKINTPFK